MKPAWLNKKIDLAACARMKAFLRGLKVETVCEQALCPNIGECFSRGNATFLILGRQCTRQCRFCNIDKSHPQPPDPGEPERVAEAVSRFGLKHAVITSVTRDDLADQGSGQFSRTIRLIRERSPGVAIEVLIPDFGGRRDFLREVVTAGPDIVGHNVETVPSLYPLVRNGAEYNRSLGVIKGIKEISPACKSKSGIMLGMGETQDEVLAVMSDLRSAGCDFLSLGQYLAPSRRHYPVKEYITPEQFALYKNKALESGFLHVESAPYVRSSYHASAYLDSI